MKLLCRLANGIRLTFDWLMSMFDALFNKHKLMRRTIVFWAMLLITWAVLNSMPRLEGGHLLSGLIAIIGILGTAITYYQWSRNQEK